MSQLSCEWSERTDRASILYRIVPAGGKIKHLHTISRTFGAEENRPVFVAMARERR